MIFFILNLSLENFINEIKNNLDIVNTKYEFLSDSKIMFEYNAMFENNYLSLGYEFSPHSLFEFNGYKDEINAKIYETIKNQNEIIFYAISDYIKALELKNELEIQNKILENLIKIQNLIEEEHKITKAHGISKIILNQAKIMNLKTKINILKNEYESTIKKLNYYVKIDSVEDILEIPKIPEYKIEDAIDYKILSYELNSNKNYLKSSYLKFIPSIKPSILRRADNTYSFMISFSIPLYPYNEIKIRKVKTYSTEIYLKSIKNILNAKLEQIKTEYNNAIFEYENYKNQIYKLEEILKNIIYEYKFSNEMSLIDYYEIENEILRLKIELLKSKYKAILKVFEVKTYFKI